MDIKSKKQVGGIVGGVLSPYWVAKGSQNRYFGFLDTQYCIPTRQELLDILVSNIFTNSIPARPEVYDCDDYAFHLKASAATYAVTSKLPAPLLIGLAWANFSWVPDEEHVCNWGYTADGGFEWIEPQWVNVPNQNHMRPLNECATASLKCVLG